MTIDEIVRPENVLCDVRATNKRALLATLAERAAAVLDLRAALVLDALVAREALGSTGMGGGIALPHARLSAVVRPFGLLARTRNAIPFDAVDERDVDLVLLVLMPANPANAQLPTLACAARRLRDPAAAAALRGARDAAAMYGVLAGSEA